MVHFPGFARTRLWIHRAVIRFCRIGFPHSEIPGSMPTCGSPRLIAACHVLHRLLLPRHPPCALSSLTIKFTQLTWRLLLPTVPVNFMIAIDSSRPGYCGPDHTSRSKALIKITCYYSPCSYPMLFSCQKSVASKASRLGGRDKRRFQPLAIPYLLSIELTFCSKFGVKRRAPEIRYRIERCRLTPNLEQLSVGTGGADRDRTGDPLLAKQVLSQLSYSPMSVDWWAWVESNYRPHPYQGCALAS